MLNALQINQNNYTLSTFPLNNRRNFEGSGKVLAVSVSEFHLSIAVQLYQPVLIRWLSLLHVYKQTTVSVIRESLSISVLRYGDFMAHSCQPSRNVFENKISFQSLLTPLIDNKLSVNMIRISLMSG